MAITFDKKMKDLKQFDPTYQGKSIDIFKHFHFEVGYENESLKMKNWLVAMETRLII